MFRVGLALSLVAVVAGAAAVLLSRKPEPEAATPGPAPSKEVRTISASTLKDRMAREPELLVAFVGTPAYFGERRIPGAICVPYAGLEANFGGVRRDRPVVLYCGCCAGDSEGVSGSAARRLMDLGFRDVTHLRGHFAAWQSLGYPCEGTNPAAQPERAFANERQKERLDEFVAETARRRVELAAAVESEKHPDRKAELERRLAENDREAEISGLELKRRISEENGDVEKVKAIDRMIEARRAAKP